MSNITEKLHTYSTTDLITIMCRLCEEVCVCLNPLWSFLVDFFISQRPCTHAGRLVERRKEEKRQRTRLLQSSARLAVDRPPCSFESLKNSPPTKAIRKIRILEQKYIPSFSLLWFPALFDILPLSPPLSALRNAVMSPPCWTLEVPHTHSGRHQQRRWARHSAFNPGAQHPSFPSFCDETDV